MFDSGVGGLSILRAVRRALPGVDISYVADSGWFPYGSKSPAALEARTAAISRFLVGQGAQLIVVACNTASNAAIVKLRQVFSLPFVGVEPAVKVAATQGNLGRIGVLCTPVTAAGPRYRHLLQQVAADKEVVTVPSEVLAGLVERGDDRRAGGRAIVQRELQPLLDAGVDTVVLGCTHYAFLGALIEELTGLPVLEPSAAVARQVARVLATLGPGPAVSGSGRTVLHTSGEVEALTRWCVEHELAVDEVRPVALG